MKLSKLYFLATLSLVGCSSSDSSSDAANSTMNNGTNLLQDSGDQMINSGNAEQIIKEIITAVNLDAIGTMQGKARSITATLADNTVALDGEAALDGFSLNNATNVASDTSIPVITQANFNCSPAGSYSQLVFVFAGAPVSQDEFSFSLCPVSQVVINGDVESSDGNRTDEFQKFSSLSISEGDAQQVISGEWRNIYTPYETSEQIVWTDARYSAFGTSFDMQVENMNWRRSGNDSRWPFNGARIGFVQDLQSNVRQITEFVYSANLQSLFTFSSASTNQQTVQADVSLNFSANYWDWEESDSLTPSIPDYPVASLGSPLTLSQNSDFSAELATVDNIARPNIPLWQSGELTVTATDGSSVTLSPNIDDNLFVTIELNTSGSTVIRALSEGFNIDLPAVITP